MEQLRTPCSPPRSTPAPCWRIAALGLLINEKAGIVNLGAEGMMLCAAIAGFATVVHTGSDLARLRRRHAAPARCWPPSSACW